MKYISLKNKQTCNLKYGVDNIFQVNHIKQKIKESKLKNHNDSNFNNRFKAKQTYLKHYNADHNMKSDIGLNEYKKSINDKYGVDFPLQNKHIMEKCKSTCFKRYNAIHPMKNHNIQIKVEQTNLKRYGVSHALQNKDILKYTKSKYEYDNNHFDSMPEMAFYIWLKDKQIPFTYHIEDGIKFLFNGKIHFYFPDFCIIDENGNKQLIEIKGLQFFKNGHMINPYNESENSLYDAKYKCMISNNVKVILQNEYQVYIDYCSKKFNSLKWYKKFKSNFK